MNPNYVKATDIEGVRREFNTNQVWGVPRRLEFDGVDSVVVKVVIDGGEIQNLSFTGSQAKMNLLYYHLVNGSLLDLDEGD
jgi:hypothetical protein